MNDFTKEDLEFLKDAVREHFKNNPPNKGSTYINVWDEMIKKIQSMIDKYQEDPWNVKKIAKSHLNEAASLITHAMCLLRMDEDE